MDPQHIGRASASALTRVLDSLPMRVFWKDLNLAYLGCNQSFADYAGIATPDEIAGKTDLDLPWGQHAESIRADDQRVIDSRAPTLRRERPFDGVPGYEHVAIVLKAPMLDADGRVAGLIGAHIAVQLTNVCEDAGSLGWSLFTESPFALGLITLTGVFLDVNRRWSQVTGVPRDEAIGHTAAELGIIDIETDAMIGREVATSGAGLDGFEIAFRRRDGTRGCALLYSGLVQIGGRTLAISLMNDITERKQAEEALHESEERYRAIFSSNVDAFLLFGTDGALIDANNRAADLYGCSRDELLRAGAPDPLMREMISAFAEAETGEWFVRESKNRRKDGEEFDVELRGAKLRYGHRDHILVIASDVTERNRARDVMRIHSDVVQNMQVGLYIYHLEDPADDRTLRLTAANPASSSGLGLSAQMMIGRTIDQIFPALRDQGIPARFADAARTGVPFNIADFVYSDINLPPTHFSFKVFPLPGCRVGVLFENTTVVAQADEEKKRFYRKTIAAATEGKLIISDPEELDEVAGPPIASYRISGPESLADIRKAVADIAEDTGLDSSRLYDLILCVGEATTNAVKHASQGVVSVHKPDGKLIVKISDNGPGIQAINLPDVALRRGYTTAVSMGMGYKAMISLADQIHLATGHGGTSVAIEIRISPLPTPPLEFSLPDTW